MESEHVPMERSFTKKKQKKQGHTYSTSIYKNHERENAELCLHHGHGGPRRSLKDTCNST